MIEALNEHTILTDLEAGEAVEGRLAQVPNLISGHDELLKHLQLAKVVDRDDPVATQVQSAQSRGQVLEKPRWNAPQAIAAGVQVANQRGAEEDGAGRRRVEVLDAVAGHVEGERVHRVPRAVDERLQRELAQPVVLELQPLQVVQVGEAPRLDRLEAVVRQLEGGQLRHVPERALLDPRDPVARQRDRLDAREGREGALLHLGDDVVGEADVEQLLVDVLVEQVDGQARDPVVLEVEVLQLALVVQRRLADLRDLVVVQRQPDQLLQRLDGRLGEHRRLEPEGDLETLEGLPDVGEGHRVDPLELVEGQRELSQFRRPPEQPHVELLQPVVAQNQRVEVPGPSHEVVHFYFADLVVADVEVRQLRARSQSLAGEIPDDVAGDAERPQGVAEGAEDVGGQVGQVVVGQVEVAQVAEPGEGPRDVVQAVSLEVNEFEDLRGKEDLLMEFSPRWSRCSTPISI